MSSPGRVCVAVFSMLAAVAGGSPAPILSARQAGAPSERPIGPTIDFVAVQADGSPVPDLQSSEVEVRINDRVRTVRVLRRVATGPTPVVAGTAARPAPPYGNNDSVRSGRSFILLVDQESLEAGRETILRNAVEGLLAQLTPSDRTMVAALPFGGVRVPFTSDPVRIRSAMEGVGGQGNRSETGSDLACRTRRFLESLDLFLEEQAGRPSPLTVVLFTAGMAAPRRDNPMALAPGMCELLVNHFERVGVAASLARANFYIAQPDDIAMSAAPWRQTIAGVGDRGSDNPLEGIEHLGGVTGAVRVPLQARGTNALLRVVRESSAYYEAELEPERDEVFGRSRALAVRVARGGVTVRARSEITFAATPPGPKPVRLAVTDLLASNAAFPDLRLRIAGFTVREPDGRLRVGVVVEPADPATLLSSVGAILIEGNERVVGQWFARDAAEHPLLGAIGAPPGTYRLRVAALDTAGRAGVAEDTVEASLTTAGPLSLGSLILGVSRNDGTEPRLEFGSEPTAIASFDIYGGAAGMRLSATVEVAGQTDGPSIVTLPLALTRVNQARVIATGAVPIGALPPGDYVIRGVIRLEDGTIGRVVRTLRKVAR